MMGVFVCTCSKFSRTYVCMAEYNNFDPALILCVTVCVHSSLTESRTPDHAEVGAREHSQATLLLLLWRGEDAVNVAIVFSHAPNVNIPQM